MIWDLRNVSIDDGLLVEVLGEKGQTAKGQNSKV